MRNRIRQWQPQLRVLFLTRVTLLKYRLNLPGFELPPTIASSQQKFDDDVAESLEAIANRFEGKGADGTRDLEQSLKQLEGTVDSWLETSQPEMRPELRTFVALSRRMESLTASLDEQI